MKIFIGILSGLLLCNTVYANDNLFDETINCEVVSSEGIISFVPPRVGSEITLDASKDEMGLNSLIFHDSTMVPLQEPLKKHFHENTGEYVVFFKGHQSESTYSKQSTNLMMGKFGDGNGGHTYSATIQEISEAKHTGLITIGQVELTCTPTE